MIKRIFMITATALLIISLISSNVAADSSESWYISKRKGSAPSFPSNAEFLSDHGCYYIDKFSSTHDEKIIYLTFDAGYENGNIEKILDTLKEEDVPAAFFVLSNLINKNADLLKRMNEEGHTVCNHTSNHKNISFLSQEEIKSNLGKLESAYEECTGVPMSKYFRYPEGSYSKESVLKLEALGYNTFFWSIAYEDWDNNKQPTEEYAMSKLMSQTHPGAVVLLHPTSSTNAKIMKRAISEWRRMGYRFGTLEELIERNI